MGCGSSTASARAGDPASKPVSRPAPPPASVEETPAPKAEDAAPKTDAELLQVEPKDEVTEALNAMAADMKSMGGLADDVEIVFVLGGPGSGKGTQCERIVEKYGYKHLSAGDLLRAEVASGSAVGKMCHGLMTEGKLVPQEVTIGLLKKEMIASGKKQFLIDGFPRALDQAQTFEEIVYPCKKVLFFDCPLETMQDRLLKRGETSGRADDNIDTIKKRFDTFQNQSLPVLDHYKAQGKAHVVSAVPPPEEVFVEVQKAIEGALDPETEIVFVLGGPGSGKGTQCERIVEKYGYTHLSAGDLLRAEVASGSEVGKMCHGLMTEGKLVPQEVTIGLLKKEMIASGKKQFLIDGFPRALDQAQTFEEMVMPCRKVLFFDCPLETMQDRLLKRGETSGRADDNIDTIKKRFDTFQNQSLPVLDHYKAQGKAHVVSAVPPPEEVFVEVQKAIEGALDPETEIVFVLGGPGSGKGTQCERIVEKYGYKHLSAGDLLREEVASGSEVGKMCYELMTEGKLVPQEVTIGLLKKEMIASGKKQFLIDGFPRALDQAQTFEEMVMPCRKVLFFDCPLETMQDRLLKRGETSGRADDNIDTIKKRFDTFQHQSLPVLDHYKAQGKAYVVSAVPPPEEVFGNVVGVFDGTMAPTSTGDASAAAEPAAEAATADGAQVSDPAPPAEGEEAVAAAPAPAEGEEAAAAAPAPAEGEAEAAAAPAPAEGEAEAAAPPAPAEGEAEAAAPPAPAEGEAEAAAPPAPAEGEAEAAPPAPAEGEEPST